MLVNKKIAFTLIELLVVIAIIGILSSLIVVTMNGVTAKANIAKSQVFSNSLRNALLINLVSEWKFDELISAVNGTTIWDSWSGGVGTLVSNDASDKIRSGDSCIYGKCLNFDGSGDYINCGNTINPLTAITVSAWINPAVVNTYTQASVLTKFTDNKYQWKIGLTNTGNLRFDVYSDQTTVISPVVGLLNAGQWYYIVGTFDGNVAAAYLNGVSGTPTSFVHRIQNTDAVIYVGGESVNGRYFNGLIDEARVYNVAIPTSRIKEQYYSGLNNLFIDGNITKEEYLSRINDYASNN